MAAFGCVPLHLDPVDVLGSIFEAWVWDVIYCHYIGSDPSHSRSTPPITDHLWTLLSEAGNDQQQRRSPAPAGGQRAESFFYMTLTTSQKDVFLSRKSTSYKTFIPLDSFWSLMVALFTTWGFALDHGNAGFDVFDTGKTLDPPLPSPLAWLYGERRASRWSISDMDEVM